MGYVYQSENYSMAQNFITQCVPRDSDTSALEFLKSGASGCTFFGQRIPDDSDNLYYKF